MQILKPISIAIGVLSLCAMPASAEGAAWCIIGRMVARTAVTLRGSNAEQILQSIPIALVVRFSIDKIKG